MPSNFRLKALVVAVSLAAGSAALAATPSAIIANTAVVTHATQLRTGDVVVGPLALTRPLHVAMSLKLRNQAQLKTFIANPHHPNLSPAQFDAEYGPTQADAEKVAAFMRQQGFSNVRIAQDRILVSGDAPASTVQSAFHTQMIHVHTRDGRDAYANSTDVRIPASLEGIVNEVLGLDTVHKFHLLPVHTEATGSMAAHNPVDFATIYNAGSTATGSTIPVGVITSGSVSQTQTDFSTFLSQNPSLGNIPLNVVTVDGGGTSASGTTEWDLDTQDIAGISGGVKSITLYDTSSLNTQPLVDDFNQAVTDDTVRVINVSIGGCETGSETNGAATGDSIFQKADAQGQTFSISSGDTGANTCGTGQNSVSWPADSEYVVAVGGTNLYTTGTTWDNETVWNTAEGAGGGGVSTFEPQPSWQNGVGANAGSSYRGLPDVSLDAAPESGANIIVNGSTEQVGGTSLSSPLFVGIWARVLATKSSLGFAAPLIYSDAAAHYSTDFHDVTSGNNGDGAPGYNATTGWDYASGFGSINIANFVSHVAGGGSAGGTPSANFTFTTSGLTANFTDTSTDSGGTIGSWSWTFGDGGTSTAQNPSHTYAAAGTYSVTETVTDSADGKQSSKTESVTVSSSGGPPKQLLGNPGFETGSAAPWSMTAGVLCSNSSCSGETAHSGQWFAWLDGYDGPHTDTVSQKVAIPSGYKSATLSYWLHIDSYFSSNTVDDTFKVQVYSSSGKLLATVGSFSNLNDDSGYVQYTANLNAYIGQTVTIKFTGTQSANTDITDFVLDDVNLNVQ